MTTYNGSKYVKDQVSSICTNLITGDEIIVGDDGSTDNTLEIIRNLSIENPEISIIVLNNNKLGTTKNLERGLRYAKGKYIFIADQDDVWLPHKVSTICDYLDENKNINLVFHNSKVSNDSISDISHESLFEYLKCSNKFKDNIKYFHFWGCMFCLRKQALEYLLPFKFGFDSWIMICCTYFKECQLIDERLMIYRRHGNNQSSFKRGNICNVLWNRLYRLVIFSLNIPRLRKLRKRAFKNDSIDLHSDI